MKYSFVIVSCLVLASIILSDGAGLRPMRFPTPQKNNVGSAQPAYKERYFDQTLDHFNFATVPQTFRQRYLINDDHWDGTGPILFYTGNEGDVTLFWDNTGFVTKTLPPIFKGLVVFAEHRYYGKSLPFGEDSLSPERVSWLTSEQALADYAVLIDYLKKSLNCEKSAVISFGGSYGGMLSGWFRLKYPHVVAGAIAASAPILQFYETGVTQWSFAQIVTDDFTKAGCSNDVRKAFSLVQLMGNTAAGRVNISTTFNLCPPLKSINDVTNFIAWLENGVESMAMIDYPYPTNFIAPVPGYPIQYSCNGVQRILKNGGNSLDALAYVAGVYYNYTGSQKCYNISADSSPSLGTNAWEYQTCTEMVMPMGTNGTSDMFPPSFWNEDAWVQYCQDTWGVTPRPNWITTYYGGKLLPNGKNDIVGTNIVWSNGRLDPWRGGGVQVTLDESMPAIIIEDGAHHLDLRDSNPADPMSVIVARKKEIEMIRKWIHEYSTSN